MQVKFIDWSKIYLFVSSLVSRIICKKVNNLFGCVKKLSQEKRLKKLKIYLVGSKW